jgi:hypothetical protein
MIILRYDVLSLLRSALREASLPELIIDVHSADRIEDLRSILTWLKRDQALVGEVRTQGESPEVGQMGLLATVVVTLGSGSAITALASSLRTWIVQRRSDLSLEIKRADGPSVRIDAKRVADTETLIRQVLNASRDIDAAPEADKS